LVGRLGLAHLLAEQLHLDTLVEGHQGAQEEERHNLAVVLQDILAAVLPSMEVVLHSVLVELQGDHLGLVVSNRQVVVHTPVVVGLLDSLAAPSQEEAVLEDRLDAHRDLLCQEHRKVAAA